MNLKLYASQTVFIYLIAVFINNSIAAQPDLERRVDSLFAKWDTRDQPGYAIGIIRNNQLILAKGYGLANLEYLIPLSASSRFYIGSMSKQFTAACLLILREQGKLSLQDKIADYLPELDRSHASITVEHLLHHTGGVREAYSLLLFRGDDNRFEHNFSNDDIFELLCRQRSLNFSPNSQYRYSSGGYILLTKIIEIVSGKSLREFANTNIFERLGMNNTFFNDNYAEIIPNRAESYRLTPEGFEKRNKNFDTYGDGGLITTIEDLALWDKAFYTDNLGVPHFGQKMYEQGILDDGQKIGYAWALQVGEYRGRKKIDHNGSMLGFFVDMVRFPQEKFTAIVLSNSVKEFPTFLAHKLADIYLGSENLSTGTSVPNYINRASKSSIDFAQLAGNYWNLDKNYFIRIEHKKDSLFLDNTNGNKIHLIPFDRDSFYFSAGNRKAAFNSVNTDNFLQFISITTNRVEDRFKKYNPEPPADANELKGFTGRYYSEELDATYRFSVEADKFYLQINQNQKKQLYPTVNNVVWNSKDMVWIGFGEIIFTRDKKGHVNGFTLGDTRVTGVNFVKEDTKP